MNEENKSKYAEDGVDTKVGDDFSSKAGKMCRRTFKNSPFIEVMDFAEGNFRGPRGFKVVGLPEGYFLEGAPDGNGTKVVITDSALSHKQAARDTVAMTASDITRWGGKPLVFVNVLDVSTLGEIGSETNNRYLEIIEGLGEVAKEQEFVCFRGETAELGSCVGSENQNALTKFNLAGFMVGAYMEDRMITGSTLAPGQIVMSLQENGFRSNGISSVRKAFAMEYGDGWWNNPRAKESILAAATPSTLYDRFLTSLNGWTNPITDPMIKMHLITHVSGGGIVDKLFYDILKPQGLSAVLDNLWNPPQIMKYVANWREIPIRECYQTFNSGNGMLVVINEEDAFDFIALSKVFGVDAKKCGTITKTDEPELTIHEKYLNEEILIYK